MLQMKNAALEMPGKKGAHALRCLNLTLPETGLVLITGASGSGKTALLRLIAGTAEPSRGEILFGGENTAKWSASRRSARHRECASADEALLLPDLTLRENAEQFCTLAGFGRRDAHENARDALTELGLESAADRYPACLTGEERRLGALACAVAREGRILLVDEPTDGLSGETAGTVLSLLLRESEQRLVVAASRDAELFGEDARVITLEDGQIASDTGESGEEENKTYPPVAGAGAGEVLRTVFSNFGKKKTRTFARTFVPFAAVLVLSLLFAAFALGRQNAADAETEMLSAYPLTLTGDAVASGDLASLADWLDSHTDVNTISVQRTYAITPHIYSGDTSSKSITALNSEENTHWTQLPAGESLRSLRYDLVSGRWPESYDEAVAILDVNGNVDSACLTALGLDPTANANITYPELLRLSFRVVLPTDEYVRNADGTWGYMGADESFMTAQIAASQSLNIVGIIRPAGEAPGESLTGGAGYLPELSEWTVETVLTSELVQAQMASPATDVLTDLPFDTTGVYTLSEDEQRSALQSYAVACTPEEQSEMYAAVTGASIETERAQDALLQAIAALTEDTLREAFAKYISSGVSPASYEENMRSFGAEAAQTVTEIRLYSQTFAARETLGTVLGYYSETISCTDTVSGLMQPAQTLTAGTEKIDTFGAVLAAVLALVCVMAASALSVTSRAGELRVLKELGLASPQSVIGRESFFLALLGSVLGAAAAYALCALFGGILAWQTAALTAAGAILASWLAAVCAASSAVK